MKVEYFVIKDMVLDGHAQSDEEIAADPRLRAEVRKRRYSITSLCPGEGLGKLWCGTTNSGGDLLYEFNTATHKFRSLKFQKVAEPDDVKIHRGLWLDRKRHSLYFGLATLSPLGKIVTGKGARIMRFDLKTEKYHELGRPSPGSYIQATAYDAGRQMMYSFTLPALGFTVTDLKTGKTKRNIPTESIVHIPAIDNDGGVWGTHSCHIHAFFRYDPDTDTFDFPETCRMPTSMQASNLMYIGAGPVDTMLTGPDGLIYVGSGMGEIYTIDPKTKKVTYLARPTPHNRLPGLVFGPDGRLYGIGGDRWDVSLFALDVKTRAVEFLGQVATKDRTCYRPHDLTYQDGRFFVGETDNPKNSGCLWALTL
ncbi:MAG: hypothetical protein PHU85_06625 [Phycisphaerae bacterium]|nr:hypothetical protein [Phycisphaerae bacterium]